MLDTRLALEWGRRILEEFRIQADNEVKAGLPLTTLASGDLETTMKGQHFFAAKVCVIVCVWAILDIYQYFALEIVYVRICIQGFVVFRYVFYMFSIYRTFETWEFHFFLLPLTTLAGGDLETAMKGQHFFATKVCLCACCYNLETTMKYFSAAK